MGWGLIREFERREENWRNVIIKTVKKSQKGKFKAARIHTNIK